MNTAVDKELYLTNQKISYKLRSSKRARLMRLAIYGDGSIVVTKPWRLNENLVEHFLKQKINWIINKISTVSKYKNPSLSRNNKEHYILNKVAALKLVEEKLTQFNKYYQLKYNHVTVRNQITRWGSCSKSRNLNFNYKVLFLTPALCDYIVVHELCHLIEFNHSADFWAQVEKTIPDYKERRKELKNTRLSFY
jgi:hypothetical protein